MATVGIQSVTVTVVLGSTVSTVSVSPLKASLSFPMTSKCRGYYRRSYCIKWRIENPLEDQQ